MATSIIGVSISQPLSDPLPSVGGSFTMGGTITIQGGGGWSESGDMHFQWDQGSASWEDIPLSGDLSTADTNPILGLQTATEQTITVDADGAGSFQVRIFLVEDDLTEHLSSAIDVTVAGEPDLIIPATPDTLYEEVTVEEDVTVELPDALIVDVYDEVTVDEDITPVLPDALLVDVYSSGSVEDENQSIYVMEPDLHMDVFDEVTVEEDITSALPDPLLSDVFDGATVEEDITVLLPDPLVVDIFDSATVEEDVTTVPESPADMDISEPYDQVALEDVPTVIVHLAIVVFDSASVEDVPEGITSLDLSVFESAGVAEDVTTVVQEVVVDLSIDVFDSVSVAEYATFGYHFYTDFTEYPNGEQPSDWTDRWQGHTHQVIEPNWALAPGKMLSGYTGSSAENLLSWDVLDGLHADCELLVLCTSPFLNINCTRFTLRGSGSATTENGYFINFDTGLLEIRKVIAGTPSLIASVPSSQVANVQYWIRFRVQGEELKAKIWGFEHEEPTAWSLETTDSDISAAGWTGISNYIGGGTTYTYHFAGATAGGSPKVKDSALDTAYYWGCLAIPGAWVTENVNWTKAWGSEDFPKGGYFYGLDLYRQAGTIPCRIAIYSGGDLATGPDGATLLWSTLGVAEPVNSWSRFIFREPIEIPVGVPVWIAIKGASGCWIYDTTDVGDSGQFDKVSGQYTSVVVPNSYLIPWADTWPADTGTTDSLWPAAIRMHTAVVPSNVIVADTVTVSEDVNVLINLAIGQDMPTSVFDGISVEDEATVVVVGGPEIIATGDFDEWIDGETVITIPDAEGDFDEWADGAPVIGFELDESLRLIDKVYEEVTVTEDVTVGIFYVGDLEVDVFDSVSVEEGSIGISTEYITDFSEYTTGDPPSDWTLRWNVTSVSSEIYTTSWGDAPGKVAVLFNQGIAARTLLTWDTLDAVDADVEMLGLMKSNDMTDYGVMLHARASGNAGAEDSYCLTIHATSMSIRWYTGGSVQELITKTHDLGTDAALADLYFWYRFRVVGTSLKGKIWRSTQAEPADWTLETTHSSIVDAGWTGYGNYRNNSIAYCYYFALSPGGGSPTIHDNFIPADNFSGLYPWAAGLSYTSGAIVRAMGGMPTTSTHVHGAYIWSAIAHSSYLRVGIYSGGSLATGPTGATLLVDLGKTTKTAGNEWEQLDCAPVAIPKGEPLWIIVKNDDDYPILFSIKEAMAGNFQQAEGRWSGVAQDDDPDTAFPTTWPADAGAFGDFWYLLSIRTDTAAVSINVFDSISVAEDVDVVILAAETHGISVTDDVTVEEYIETDPSDQQVSIFDVTSVEEDITVEVEGVTAAEVDVFDSVDVADEGTVVLSSPAPLTISVYDEVSVAEDIVFSFDFFTDFSEYSTGNPASDWTERWDNNTVDNTVEAASWEFAPGKVLHIDNDVGQNHFTSWDVLDGYADIETLSLIKCADIINHGARVIMRGAGSGAAETGYYLRHLSVSFQIAKYVTGGNSTVEAAAHELSSSGPGAKYWWQRFRVEDTTLKFKIWEYNQVEPEHWLIVDTDTSISSGGWTGLGGWTISDIYCYYFAASSGGGSPALPSNFEKPDYFGTLEPQDASEQLVNYVKAVGGQAPDGEKVYGADIYVGATHTGQGRFAIYSGGDLDSGPDGATLLADLGESVGSDVDTWLRFLCEPVDIPSDEPLWIAFKGDGDGFYVQYNNTSGNAGSFQITQGWFISNTVSTNEETAWPDTWPVDGGGFSPSWSRFRILIDSPWPYVIVNDAVTVSEEVTVDIEKTELSVNVFDTVDVTEYVEGFQPTKLMSTFDVISVSEDISFDILDEVIVSDEVTVDEDVTVAVISLIPVEPSIFDSVNVTDIPTIEVSDLFTAVFDGISVTESAEAVVPELSISVVDSTNLDDIVTTAIAFEVTIFDTVGVSEDIESYLGITASVFDTISVADVPEGEILLSTSVFSAVAITEDLTILITSPDAITVYVTDSLNVTDSIEGNILLEVVVADSTAISDDITASTLVNISVFDGIVVQDVPSLLTPELIVSAYDNVSVAEQVIIIPDLAITVVDNVSVSEAVFLETSNLAVSVVDVASVNDPPTLLLGEEGPIDLYAIESVSISESLSTIVSDLDVSVYDTVDVVESSGVTWILADGLLRVYVDDLVIEIDTEEYMYFVSEEEKYLTVSTEVV